MSNKYRCRLHSVANVLDNVWIPGKTLIILSRLHGRDTRWIQNQDTNQSNYNQKLFWCSKFHFILFCNNQFAFQEKTCSNTNVYFQRNLLYNYTKWKWKPFLNWQIRQGRNVWNKSVKSDMQQMCTICRVNLIKSFYSKERIETETNKMPDLGQIKNLNLCGFKPNIIRFFNWHWSLWRFWTKIRNLCYFLHMRESLERSKYLNCYVYFWM